MTRHPIPLQSMTDQDGKPVGTAFLMPAREGTCETCATAHEPELPQNAQSLFYQTRFNIEHGRPATWIDAMAHCASELQALWRAKLIELGVDVDGGKIRAERRK